MKKTACLLILLFISFGIIIHHYLKHIKNDKLNIVSKYFQIDDVNNHESWFLFFIGIFIGLLISMYI